MSVNRRIAGKAKKRRAVYQLKVSLRDIEPLIWRRIQVSEDTKLPRLHRVLQLLFNWEDYHLHEFIVGRRVYSVPEPDDELYERKVDGPIPPPSRCACRLECHRGATKRTNRIGC